MVFAWRIVFSLVLLLAAPRCAGGSEAQALEAMWTPLGGAELARHASAELLAGSIEDYEGILGSEGVSIGRVFGTATQQELEWVLSWQTTPAATWHTGRLPPALEASMRNASATTCRAACRASGRGQGGECCAPEERCPRISNLLKATLAAAQSRCNAHFLEHEAAIARVIRSAWPFALPQMLPPLAEAALVVERMVWLFVIMSSRYVTDPGLAHCFSSEWGQALKWIQLQSLENLRLARRAQEKVQWELIATSRFYKHNWTHVGVHVEEVKMVWQHMSNVLTHLRRFFNWVRVVENQEGGWGKLVNRTASITPFSGEEGVKVDNGEYNSMGLARYCFLNECRASGPIYDDARSVDDETDRAVMRYLLRNVLKVDQTIGEFGAFAGYNSAWFNETGLVTAFAFDAIPNAAKHADGRVQFAQLAEHFDLGRTFDWVLCLEVGEHMPPGTEDQLLENIARHARLGAIISWATPNFPSPAHPNTMLVEDSTAVILRHGFKQDELLTKGLREAASYEWHRETIGVYWKQTPLR